MAAAAGSSSASPSRAQRARARRIGEEPTAERRPATGQSATLLFDGRPSATCRFGCNPKARAAGQRAGTAGPQAGTAGQPARTVCPKGGTVCQKAWSAAEPMAGRTPAADRSEATSRSRSSGRPPAAGRSRVTAAGLMPVVCAAEVRADRSRAPGGRAGAGRAGNVRPPRRAAKPAGQNSADREPPARAGGVRVSTGEHGLAGLAGRFAFRDRRGRVPRGCGRHVGRHPRAGHCPAAAQYRAPARHRSAAQHRSAAGHRSSAGRGCP
jgi:hypothetical protein